MTQIVLQWILNGYSSNGDISKLQKNIINEAGEAGRDHVNPPKGGILIIVSQ